MTCTRCGAVVKPNCPHIGALCCSCADLEANRLLALFFEAEAARAEALAS